MAEVKHRNDCQPIKLEILTFTLRGIKMDGDNILFEHKLQSLSRFARAHADPTCFAYLTRTSAAAHHSVCHVFQAVEEDQVGINKIVLISVLAGWKMAKKRVPEFLF
jgi:hypothetical protein